MNLQIYNQIKTLHEFDQVNKNKKIVEHYNSRFYAVQMLLDFIIENYLSKNADCMILITGFKGKGKSSLALRFLLEYQKKRPDLFVGGVRKNLKEKIIFESNPLLIKERVATLPKQSMLIFDEGARFLLAEDWNKKSNKKLKKVFAEIRTQNNIYIVNCPYKIRDIDKKYVGSLFEFWIHVFDWDKAVCFRRNANPILNDFDLEVFEKKIKFIPNTMGDKRWKEIRQLMMQNSKTYFISLKWGVIPKKIYSRYEELRFKAVFGDIEKARQLEQMKEEIELKKEELKKQRLLAESERINLKFLKIREEIEKIKNPVKKKISVLDEKIKKVLEGTEIKKQDSTTEQTTQTEQTA